MFLEDIYNITLALSGYILKFMIPVFFMPFLLWFAFRAHNSSEASKSEVSSRGLLIFHSSLNIFVVLVWILMYGEHYINHDNRWFPIFDVGALLGMFGLLFVIPVGLITSWYIEKKNFFPVVNKPAYVYILASKIFYVISAIFPFWMVLFYTGMVLNE